MRNVSNLFTTFLTLPLLHPGLVFEVSEIDVTHSGFEENDSER